MVKREFWIRRVEEAWKKRSIVWLYGVRRVGKTSLCLSLDDIIYYDCERGQVRDQLENNYEHFLQIHKGKRVALDEIHKLENPSELLKVAADHYPETKIIATGSSVLEATKKFSDTLTGRKVEIHLTPMLLDEGVLFGNPDLKHRMLYGGLPPFFLADELLEFEYREWFHSYWSKDVQELFRLEKKSSFIKFTKLMLAQSGSMFVGSKFAGPCGVSHPTIANYLEVVKDSFVATVVAPFSTFTPTEIRATPKVYGFDTGFASYAKRWTTLRNDDCGILWEHIVLNELLAYYHQDDIHYWRDKQGREVDFVLLQNRNIEPICIECKWNSKYFDVKNIQVFRSRYPEGKNYVVSPYILEPYEKKHADIIVSYVSLKDLIKDLLG